MTEEKLDPMGKEYMLKRGSSHEIADALISGSEAGYSWCSEFKEREASMIDISALGLTGCLATIVAVADALEVSPAKRAYAVGFVSGIRWAGDHLAGPPVL
jgi:hypothetical protein